jgi:replicative DNA helicase
MGKPVKQLSAGIPQDVQAELAVLGTLLLENDAFFDAIGDLSTEDFSLDSHKRIFGAIAAIMDGMEEGVHHADPITLQHVLRKRGELGAVGGVAYISDLTTGIPRKLNIEEHVKIIREKAKLRLLMEVGKNLYQAAEGQFADSTRLIEGVNERLIRAVADEKSEAVRVGEIAPIVEANILSKRNQSLDKDALELTWGLEDLDRFTKGMFGGELTVIGGDSGGGKTSLQLQIVLANALAGVPCGIFSMEMKAEQLVKRLYPLLSEIITSRHIRDPRLLNLHTDVPEMQRLSKVMAGLPIWIDDTSPLTLQKLRARAKMMRYRHKIRVLAGDYFQLIEVPGSTGVDKIEKIAFGMRDFAKSEPEMHTILLSQYSKANGFMKKQRRTKSDLMGGSAIHHAAQNVLLITIESAAKRDPDDLLDVEIMVDKQRDGATGRVTCCYDRKRLRFVPSTQQEKSDASSSRNAEAYKNRAAGPD